MKKVDVPQKFYLSELSVKEQMKLAEKLCRGNFAKELGAGLKMEKFSPADNGFSMSFMLCLENSKPIAIVSVWDYHVECYFNPYYATDFKNVNKNMSEILRNEMTNRFPSYQKDAQNWDKFGKLTKEIKNQKEKTK